MKKGYIIIISIIFLAIIGFLIWYVFFKKEEKTFTSSKNSKPSFTDEIDENKILYMGLSGNSVMKFQEILNSKIKLLDPSIQTVKEDGYFGELTESAIQKLSCGIYSSQKRNITINSIKFRTNKYC